MARLALSLLGPFEVTLDGVPVTALDSLKARALLAYLAVEAGRPHSRDLLAKLLWPGWPDRSARTNLHNALANLREAIRDPEAAPPHLLIARETIQFDPDSDYWLDVATFRALLEAEHPAAPRIEDALTLYRGPFLEGFSVGDSAPFEHWALQVREQLKRQVLAALERLAAQHKEQGEIGRALVHTRRQVELAPWQEKAHRSLIRLLARNGERSAALTQFEACRRLLKEELDVEPAEETTELHRRIRDGLAQGPSPTPLQDTAPLVPPTGTVTFLFTDIQGSTPLWEQKPAAMKAAVARHHVLLRQAIEANRGIVFKVIGDEFQAAFDLAPQALAAALAAQRALQGETWGETGPLRVRMGLHTGPAEWTGEDYAVSHTLNRAARVMSAGHGGQILLSQEAADLVSRQLSPGVSLRDLGEHRLKGLAHPELLYQATTPDLPQDYPPLATVSQHPHNLPTQLTSFVGREDLLTQIGERLRDPTCRLLTLAGPGGSGKTRLALEAAAMEIDRYPHGVFFVPLAPLRSVESIVPTVAQALEFAFYGQGEPKAQLLDYLRGKRLLLVLDNFEHLVEGASITTDILQAAPEVVVLVTSRVGLHVQGEHRFPVEGMAYPDQTSEVCQTSEVLSRCSAVKLFLESARRAQPGFALTADNLAGVARICGLVEGMPLGILLAAVWVALFTPAEIGDEIARNLDFLETDLRDAPERQRSLRAAFDHSWNLLNKPERETFAALSVFCGGFTRQAAQQVAAASPRELMALADKSLLHRTPGGRYEVHELLRQYAAEQLAASPDGEPAARDRHSVHYAAALERWAADLKGPRQQAALKEIEAEVEDARAAWDWAVEQEQLNRLDQAMEGLGLFYDWRALPGGRVGLSCRDRGAGDVRGSAAGNACRGTADVDQRAVVAGPLCLSVGTRRSGQGVSGAGNGPPGPSSPGRSGRALGEGVPPWGDGRGRKLVGRSPGGQGAVCTEHGAVPGAWRPLGAGSCPESHGTGQPRPERF